MTTVDDVLSWDLTQLPVAAASLDTLADRLVDAGSAAVAHAHSDADWHGATHDAATARIDVVNGSLRRTARAVAAAARATRSGHARLEQSRTALRQQVYVARVAGFAVSASGAATHSDHARAADALYLTEKIQSKLAAVAANDSMTSNALHGALESLDGSGDSTSVVLPGGPSGAPNHAAQRMAELPPAERRPYWESLSPAERNRVITADPGTVGNLDGVPFTGRITANRLSMLNLLADEERLGREDGPAADKLRTLLDDDRRFIAFDPDAGGRFVELIGDIDQDAPGVAVFVPGTGTALDDSESLRANAQALHKRTKTPVIVYANGDFPQTIVGNPLHGTRSMAIDPRLAMEAAPRLAAFGKQLDVELAITAPGVPTTVIGHSYGGSIVGTAEQLGMRADRVVYASSAGTGTLPDAEWSNPDPDVRRYSLTAPGDLIHIAQEYGGLVHGGDPDTAPGVTRLDTGYSGPDENGNRHLLEGTSAHSSYLSDPESDAFEAIAQVVIGEEPDHYVDRAPDLPGADELEDVERTLTLAGKIAGTMLLDRLVAPFTAPFR
ncbi:alpha/beta hydrolase [Gordonia zhaorongruii]|uniref:alpha/beta hydrolase n=1 Tax=Gordonia zhaorongruii TaxID=2597659 RepID=UPI0010456D47|nr:alpha/beta hydrolase [Gordonia zhaorongruii]